MDDPMVPTAVGEEKAFFHEAKKHPGELQPLARGKGCLAVSLRVESERFERVETRFAQAVKTVSRGGEEMTGQAGKRMGLWSDRIPKLTTEGLQIHPGAALEKQINFKKAGG